MGSNKGKSILYAIASIVVLGFALFLRLENARIRQFHADEGVQAYQAWKLAETGEYKYDPSEHHGPSLYYVTRLLYPLIRDEAGEVDDFRMRLVPTAFSIGLLVFGLWAFRRFDPITTCLWASICAVAPVAVIYGSYFVQESLFALSSLAFLYSVFRYASQPDASKVLWMGLALGVMHITKETAVIHVFAIILTVVVARYLIFGRPLVEDKRRTATHLLILVAIVLALHVTFFSSFFSNPYGIVDGILSHFQYVDRSQGQGHEKGLFYYVSIFWPHVREGIHWSELSFLVLSVLGTVFAFGISPPIKSDSQKWAQFMATFAWILLLLYSIIPYKTPWLMLTPYVAFAYVAAFSLSQMARFSFGNSGGKRLVYAIAGIGLATWLVTSMNLQVRKGIFRYASATRNPYLYQHTTPRYASLLSTLKEATLSANTDYFSVGVYSPDFAWPLPWHLRNVPKVGYWSSLDAFSSHTIDIIDSRLLEENAFEWNPEDNWQLFGLRPNTILACRISPLPDVHAKIESSD